MKRKIGMELISKELVISAGVGVIIGILVLSYAANNLNKIQDIEDTNVLYGLAQEILSAHDLGAIDNKGVANSLASKVMAAYKALGEDDADAAVAALEDLISHVRDQKEKHISEDVSNELIAEAEAVINGMVNTSTIECDPMCISETCKDVPPELKDKCEADACSPGGACYPQ